MSLLSFVIYLMHLCLLKKSINVLKKYIYINKPTGPNIFNSSETWNVINVMFQISNTVIILMYAILYHRNVNVCHYISILNIHLNVRYTTTLNQSESELTQWIILPHYDTISDTSQSQTGILLFNYVKTSSQT